MKKIILVLAAIITFTSFALADERPMVPKTIEVSFKARFPAATEVNWNKKDDLSIAEFKENESKYMAYFDAKANLLATLKYITTDHMPFSTFNALKGKYDLSKMKALEVSLADGEIFYLLDIFKNDKLKVVKVYVDGSTEIIRK